MMKKIAIFLIFTFSFLIFTLAHEVGAQSPTPEATSPAVQQIREKVKEIVREKIEEVKKGQVRAFVGEISKINNLNITITNPRGEKQIKVSEETKIIGKGRKEIKLEDLVNGNFILAMGYLGDNGVLEARRIVVAEKPKLPARAVAFGKVTDISTTEEKILTVKNEKKGITYTVVVTDKTIITKRSETRIKKVNFSAIEKGDRVVAVGTPTENETKLITAKIIHVIPGKATGQEVTPTPKASPTPTPKSTLTPTPTE